MRGFENARQIEIYLENRRVKLMEKQAVVDNLIDKLKDNYFDHTALIFSLCRKSLMRMSINQLKKML